MKDDITIDGTNAALSQQDEDTSTATKLYRTQDAATLAGIQSPQLRNARKRFMKLADRLNLKPADERRRERGGGSLEKFWTLEQIQAVKAEHQRTAKPKKLDDRANNIRRLQADMQRKAIEIGKELNAAKAEMPHGNWANWLEENFKWSERTAQYFMNIAKRFGDNPEFAEFKTSTLRALLDLPEGTEQDFINVQATIGKPVKDQSERELKAAIKQQKKRKKNPAPVTVDTPPPQIDSEPVNHINTNDKGGKSERAFVFEGYKPRNDAILQGYNTPCQAPATQPADALIDSELAEIFARIDKITDADKLRRIQAHISNRLANLQIKKDDPAKDSEPAGNEIEIDRATFNTILLHAEKISNGQVDFVPILQRELNGLAQTAPVVVPVVDLRDRVQDFVSQLPLIIRDDDRRYRLIKLAENSFELDLIAVPAVSDDSDIAGKKNKPANTDASR